MPQRAPDIAPRTVVHAKTQAPPAGAGGFVTTRAVDREQQQRQHRQQGDINRPHLRQRLDLVARFNEQVQAEIEQRHLDDAQIDRQHHDGEKKAQQLFQPGAGVFKAVAVARSRRPDVFAQPGLGPEAIDPQCNQGQKCRFEIEREQRSRLAMILAMNGRTHLSVLRENVTYCLRMFSAHYPSAG